MNAVTPVSFSLAHCAVSVSTFTMSGFADGDALKLEFPNEDFEIQYSSDGHSIAVMKHDGAKCDGVIRLGQGNMLIAMLRQLHEASLRAGGIRYPFSAVNTKSPDERAAGSLLFMGRIPILWGDTAQAAEFKFDLAVTEFTGGTLIPT